MYKVEGELPGRRDLFWVMDPVLSKEAKANPKNKKEANSTAFNTFSVSVSL